MNRAQRRSKPSRAKRAAMALLVAGTLASGALTDLYADATMGVNDELAIHGGGGGGGQGCGTGFGGGGGGYVEYKDDGATISYYYFGTGGDASASGANGGSIGGGNGANGVPGGGSGGYGAQQGNGGGSSYFDDASDQNGITTPFTYGIFPGTITPGTTAGGLGVASATGGDGGNANTAIDNSSGGAIYPFRLYLYGGDGGSGSDGGNASAGAQGADATGTAGNGGNANLTVTGSITVTGEVAVNAGLAGRGGNGGSENSGYKGGDGGPGGDGGNAGLTVTSRLTSPKLTLISSANGPPGTPGAGIPSAIPGSGGSGGNASADIQGTLDAGTITLTNNGAAGKVSLTVGTLLIRGNTAMSYTGTPSVTVAVYRFDLNGVSSGDEMLDMTGGSTFNLSWINSSFFSFEGTANLSGGDTVTLIDSVSGSFTPRTLTYGDYAFDIEVISGALVATVVTDADPNYGPGPDSDSAPRPRAVSQDTTPPKTGVEDYIMPALFALVLSGAAICTLVIINRKVTCKKLQKTRK